MELDSYKDKMLMAFVQKEKKFKWYKKTFDKYNINGVDRFIWQWSWWAFFGGCFYLLYRKAYLYSLICFMLPTIGSSNNIITLISLSIILHIASGGILPYFVYLQYKRNKEKIESKITDETKRIETMTVLGGTNGKLMFIFTAIPFFIALIFMLALFVIGIIDIIIV